MRPIQFLLVLGLLASLVLYRYAFRSTLRDRILALGFVSAGLIAVLFPDYTSVLAEYLGVGRGTDLVMYFFIVTTIFFGIHFFSKVARIERCQTELVRALAIAAARPAEREKADS
jgi:hypothetical protein